MFNFNIFITVLFTIACIGQSNACQELMVADFIEEIKLKEGDLTIKKTEEGFYINPSLLVLQDDGIHLNYDGRDFLVPFLYHDTKGYFLSHDACYNLGNKWMCCRCNTKNDILISTCRVCLKLRCPI